MLSDKTDIASARNRYLTLVCIDLLLLAASPDDDAMPFELQACARLKTYGERVRVVALILPEQSCSASFGREAAGPSSGCGADARTNLTAALIWTRRDRLQKATKARIVPGPVRS